MPPEEESGVTTESVESAPVVQLTEDELRKLAEILWQMLVADLRIERERLGR